MVKIYNSEITNRMINGLSISSGTDTVPTELMDKVYPTYSVSEKPLVKVLQTNLNTLSSDISVIVPTGKQWKILYGNVSLIASATVGNRVVQILLQNQAGTKIMWSATSPVNHAAGLTKFYELASSSTVPAETVTGRVFLPMPDNMIIPSTFVLRCKDNNTVDAAADSWTITLVIEETTNRA